MCVCVYHEDLCVIPGCIVEIERLVDLDLVRYCFFYFILPLQDLILSCVSCDLGHSAVLIGSGKYLWLHM